MSGLDTGVNNIDVDTRAIVVVLVAPINCAINLVQAPRHVLLESGLVQLRIELDGVVLFARLTARVVEDGLKRRQVHLCNKTFETVELSLYLACLCLRGADLLCDFVHMLCHGLTTLQARLTIFLEGADVCIECIGIFGIPHTKLPMLHVGMEPLGQSLIRLPTADHMF